MHSVNDDVFGEQSVKRIVDLAELKKRLRAEVRDLSACVDAGIGSPCADDMNILLKNLRKDILNLGLNRRSVFLPLPAAVPGTIVLDKKFDVTHEEEVLGARDNDSETLGNREDDAIGMRKRSDDICMNIDGARLIDLLVVGNGKTSGINGAQKMIDADRRNHEHDK